MEGGGVRLDGPTITFCSFQLLIALAFILLNGPRIGGAHFLDLKFTTARSNGLGLFVLKCPFYLQERYFSPYKGCW